MNLRVFYLYKTVGFGWLQKNEIQTYQRTPSSVQSYLAPFATAPRPRCERLSAQIRTRLDPDALAYRPRCDKRHKP